MPDEAAGFEPEDPQGEWLDDHAAATLLAMKAEHEGKQDTRWTCTRPELEAALRETAHGRHLTPAALTALADAVLARLPEASPDARDRRLAELENAINWNTTCLACSAVLDSSIREHSRAEKAEDEAARLRQALADKDGQLAILKGQVDQ